MFTKQIIPRILDSQVHMLTRQNYIMHGQFANFLANLDKQNKHTDVGVHRYGPNRGECIKIYY